MIHMPASEARTHFADVLSRVEYRGERIMLQRRGKDVAVFIPVEEYEYLERMIKEAEDKLDRAAFRKAKRGIKKHGTVPWETVKKELGL